jgi:hypothetical protein
MKENILIMSNYIQKKKNRYNHLTNFLKMNLKECLKEKNFKKIEKIILPIKIVFNLFILKKQELSLI